MKSKKFIFSLAFIILASFSYGQKEKSNDLAVAEFATSAVCGMCKTTLESGILYEKGVKKSNLDVSTKVFTVWYRADKTNEESLRKAISKLGYDADSVKADTKAYDNLVPCCKKDAHQEEGMHEQMEGNE